MINIINMSVNSSKQFVYTKTTARLKHLFIVGKRRFSVVFFSFLTSKGVGLIIIFPRWQ